MVTFVPRIGRAGRVSTAEPAAVSVIHFQIVGERQRARITCVCARCARNTYVTRRKRSNQYVTRQNSSAENGRVNYACRKIIFAPLCVMKATISQITAV